MMRIEDICLGDITFLDFGNNILIDIWDNKNEYSLGYIHCNGIKQLIIENDNDDDGFFGEHISFIEFGEVKNLHNQMLAFKNSTTVNEGYLVRMESDSILCKLLCTNIEIDIGLQKIIKIYV